MTQQTTNTLAYGPGPRGTRDLVLRGVSAWGELDGLMFGLSVEQRYRNDSARAIEAVFTFPVPLGAVLTSLELEWGERRLQARIVARAEALDRYERAIDDGDAAVLLESAGNGLHTLSVGNLKPGETVIIRYRHAELLDANRGRLRLRIPTVIAPRYGDPAAAGLEGPAVPYSHALAEYPFSLELALHGVFEASGVESPTHAVSVRQEEEGLRVELARPARLDRDFVLELPQAGVTRDALVARDGDDWLVVASAVPEDLPGTSRPLVLTVVVDCSGSMQGDSIDAAKRALVRVIDGLTEADRIGLLRFGTHRAWVSDGLEPCTASRLETLRAAVCRFQADLGGTEMSAALEEAVGAAVSPGETGDLLLVTDGQVQDLEALVDLVGRSGRRLFVVAVGAAPNEALARRLSGPSGGACEFVASGELAESAILRMFRRLRAEPCVVQSVRWPASPLWELPAPGAVFPDETVHLIAAFRERPQGAVRVLLLGVDGASREIRLNVAEDECAGPSLARIAGSRRLPRLDQAEAAALALRLQIASRFTSFLVVDERAAGEKSSGLPATVRIRQMLAAGWAGAGAVSLSMSVSPRIGAASRDGAGVPHALSASSPKAAQVSDRTGEPPRRDTSPAEPTRWWPILGALARLDAVASFDALRTAGLDSATLLSLERLRLQWRCSEREVVDAVIEVIVELAGRDTSEARALRRVWKPHRSLFSGRQERQRRQSVREILLAEAPP